MGRISEDAAENGLFIHEVPSSVEKEIIVNQLRNPLKRKRDENSEKSKERLREAFEKVLSKIKSPDDVEIIDRLLQPMIPTLEARNAKQTFASSSCSSSNAKSKFEPQRRFFCTKKTKKKLSLSLSKPTEGEQEAIAANLLLR